MTEAIKHLRELLYAVPEQALDIPLDRFPAAPRDGMRLAVARALQE